MLKSIRYTFRASLFFSRGLYVCCEYTHTRPERPRRRRFGFHPQIYALLFTSHPAWEQARRPSISKCFCWWMLSFFPSKLLTYRHRSHSVLLLCPFFAFFIHAHTHKGGAPAQFPNIVQKVCAGVLILWDLSSRGLGKGSVFAPCCPFYNHHWRNV